MTARVLARPLIRPVGTGLRSLYWLVMAGLSGLIVWTPVVPGAFPVVVRVEDPAGAADTQSFTVAVAGDSEPRVSGHTSFRSVIPTEQMPEELRWNAATLWAGPRVHHHRADGCERARTIPPRPQTPSRRP